MISKLSKIQCIGCCTFKSLLSAVVQFGHFVSTLLHFITLVVKLTQEEEGTQSQAAE
jgi:hypothetical protein